MGTSFQSTINSSYAKPLDNFTYTSGYSCNAQLLSLSSTDIKKRFRHMYWFPLRNDWNANTVPAAPKLASDSRPSDYQQQDPRVLTHTQTLGVTIRVSFIASRLPLLKHGISSWCVQHITIHVQDRNMRNSQPTNTPPLWVRVRWLGSPITYMYANTKREKKNCVQTFKSSLQALVIVLLLVGATDDSRSET